MKKTRGKNITFRPLKDQTKCGRMCHFLKPLKPKQELCQK